MKKLAAAILFCLYIFSCGIKGPPLPPIEETTIQQQKPTENVSENTSPASASGDATKVKKKTK